MNGKLFIVSNRLPLTVDQNEHGVTLRPSPGGLTSAVSAYLAGNGKGTFREQIWVGYPDCTEDAWLQAVSNNDMQADYTYLPVFIDYKLYQGYYNGFSNSLLWPLFHYFPTYAAYNDSDYDAYMQVNKLFAHLIVQQIAEQDVLWIHDYHLLPLAALIREKCPGLTIGFFLHIPFPSYQIFRLIPKGWQFVLLKGMAAADLIGFHTIDYSADFLISLERVLNIRHDDQWFLSEGRLVKADVFPIGIDYEQFYNAAGTKEVARIRDEYMALKGSKKMLFSVDRLDYTKGLFNRLKGYHRFLTEHPEYIGEVIFVLVVIPSRDEIEKYAENKKIIDEYIGNLNSSLGDIAWQPVLYHYNSLRFEELVALYTACDLALITPLRDGMNLVCKEYVASRIDQKGVLILSEMAGAAIQLTDALLINPNDTQEMADVIKKAMEMPEAEQRHRMAQMQKVVAGSDVNTWASDFLETLSEIKQRQVNLQVNPLGRLTREGLLDAYGGAGRRLFLLDYDGTLTPLVKHPSDAIPNQLLLQIIQRLSADTRNDIFIISGRDSITLENWLGHLQIGIVAEHGAKMKNIGGQWHNMPLQAEDDWMLKIRPLMELQSDKCPKAFLEQKQFSLAWHYRNSEPVQGERMAAELYNKLLGATVHLPVNVLLGNKVIEVRPDGVDKGSAVKTLLAFQTYDFVLCIGDDKTDEDMFKTLANNGFAYTIKVGHEASFAKYNLQSPNEVIDLLQNIADHTNVPVANDLNNV